MLLVLVCVQKSLDTKLMMSALKKSECLLSGSLPRLSCTYLQQQYITKKNKMSLLPNNYYKEVFTFITYKKNPCQIGTKNAGADEIKMIFFFISVIV